MATRGRLSDENGAARLYIDPVAHRGVKSAFGERGECDSRGDFVAKAARRTRRIRLTGSTEVNVISEHGTKGLIF